MRLLLLIEYSPVCASTILKLASCLLLAIAFAWPTPTLAATITVDSSADTTTAGDGACTLREAVANAKNDDGSDTTGGDCATGDDGPDTINIANNVSTITIGASLNILTATVTINGNGATIDAGELTGSSGVFRLSPGYSLNLDRLTIVGGGGGGQGVLHLGGDATVSNVTIRDFSRTAIVTASDLGGTYTLTNILMEDGASGTYVGYYGSGLAFQVGNNANITVNNLVLRRLAGGNAALTNSRQTASLTITGCFTHEAIFPQVTYENVTNNSTGDCTGTIGNGDSAAREVTPPQVSDCGMPLTGVLVEDATYNLLADCQMSGTLYIPKGLNVTINGNQHVIFSSGGSRIMNNAAALNLNNVVLTGSGSAGPLTYWLQNDSIVTNVAFRDNLGPVTLASHTVEFDRVLFEGNSTTSTSRFGASALRVLLWSSATVRNSAFRNNSGGPAAINVAFPNTRGDSPSLTLVDCIDFSGNSPQDVSDAASYVIDESMACPGLEDVGPVVPTSPQKGPKKRTTTAKENAIPQIKPRVQTCPALAPGITVTDLTGETQCQRIDVRGVGKSQVVQAGIIDAADVWSWVENDTEVCFLASGAVVVFLDANHAPRTVETLPTERRNEYTCAKIPHHGSVVLLRSLPAGLSQPVVDATPMQPLHDCMVTLSAILNLREYPHGMVLAVLPAFVSLTALDRTPGWFKVDYHGKHGWISADFVTPHGDCA